MAAYSYDFRPVGNFSPQLVVLAQLQVGSKLQITPEGKLEHSYGSSSSWVSFGLQKISRTFNGKETDLENVLNRVEDLFEATRNFFNPKAAARARKMLNADIRKIRCAAQGLRNMQMGYFRSASEKTPFAKQQLFDRIGQLANAFDELLPQQEA